jgi:peptide chain release factor 2
MEKESFWMDREKAEVISKKYKTLREEIDYFEILEIEIQEAKNEGEVEQLEREIERKEKEFFLSGKYDRGNAILMIEAGQGGKDAQDFAAILLSMYQKYLTKKGFKIEILDRSFGEPGPEGRIGIKSCILEVKGKYAYGILKGERGVHRLVRISPFSAKGLRHTSFVLVQVLPKIEKEEINIKPSDLKFEFAKSSGAGGQYVNKRMTAVRVTHLPTGITVKCQTERSLAQNKEKAMEVLLSRINQLMEQEKEKEIEKLKGKKIEPSWGNQIRNYVLDPYKVVKDLRTKVEKKNVEEVFEGNLDEFIDAEIKHDKIPKCN